MLHVNGNLWFLHDASVTSFEPVVPPPHRLATPLDCGTWHRVIRESVVPRTDDRLHGHLHLFEHPRDAVAISVEHAADHENRDLDRIERAFGLMPKAAVALVSHVIQRPGRIIKAANECLLIDGEIGRAAQGLIEVHGDLELVDVHHAVDVVHVFFKEIFGGADRYNRLQGRRVSHRQLQGIESAPGNAEHPDVAIRPRLPCQPSDDL